MKKSVSVLLVVGLLAIVPLVEAGRLCKLSQVCHWHSRVEWRASATLAPIATNTPVSANVESGDSCDLSYPNPQIPGTCANTTRVSQLATWAAANCAAGEWTDGTLNCLATVAPTWTPIPAYP